MRLFGLVGRTLGYSFSQRFFRAKFAKEKIDADFRNFEILTIEEFPDIFREYPMIEGLSVTIPYKESIIPLLDSLSSEARHIGAVNVVRPTAEGLIGYNSDCVGFRNALRELLRPHHRSALVLGSGGASKAVLFVLDELGIQAHAVSRTPDTSRQQIGYGELPVRLPDTEIIINTTPLGTYPDTNHAPDIPYHLLSEKHLLFDLVYNPEVTLFMQRAKEQGATVSNGFKMLEYQALKAWEIWNA